MHLTSQAPFLLATGPPGMGEALLLLAAAAAAAIVLPFAFCFLGGRGRTPIIWRPFIYVLAVLIGAPAGAWGGYATLLGLAHLLNFGPGSSFFDTVMVFLPGLLIGGGLVPFGIARALTKPDESLR